MNKIVINNNKGFTLIELLVVIAVIGLLAGVVIVALNDARAKGRDARRVRDIQELHNAVELYIAQNGHAPDLGNLSCLDLSGNNTDCFTVDTQGSWSDLYSNLAPYMKSLPSDPCGVGCADKQSKYLGWFAYKYEGPGSLVNYYQGLDIPVSLSSYRLYAQNLESKNSSFGFGEGSF